MDEQKRKSPEVILTDDNPQAPKEIDREAAHEFAREAMERRYMYFLD